MLTEISIEDAERLEELTGHIASNIESVRREFNEPNCEWFDEEWLQKLVDLSGQLAANLAAAAESAERLNELAEEEPA